MGVNAARLVIAGLSGDAGKTIVSLSLLAALRRRDRVVSVFKKGPDYIDAAWLGFVVGGVCRNLDTYLVPEGAVRQSFIRHSGGDIALIEGNRGLFDGKDVQGTHSTAGLAKLVQAPIVLVVDATKMTRTVAAVVHGCMTFDSDVHIAGVVLNRVAGKRHGAIISGAIEHYCGIPVLGMIPKLGEAADLIPGRHLGLVPPAEAGLGDDLVDRLAGLAEQYLDIDGFLDIAAQAVWLPEEAVEDEVSERTGVRIGYFRDSVFTFYYPENLEALTRQGAELVPISSLEDRELPEIDGLYIGGGFPETHADRLAANRVLMQAIRLQAEAGLPIYAECGGLIYLARSLAWKGQTYAMAGVFGMDLEMRPRPVGHGYAELHIERENPYFPSGTVLYGHEFHYSGPTAEPAADEGCARVVRGVGVGNRRDGLVRKSTFAAYTHLHADGVPEWAPAFVRQARRWREQRSSQGGERQAEEGREKGNGEHRSSERDRCWASML